MTTTSSETTRYISVHVTSNVNLQTDDGIRHEFASWLEGLGATVHSATVRPADGEMEARNV